MVNGYKPSTLQEALEIRAREKVIPYAGGTDLMVQNPADPTYLFLNDIEEIKQIIDDGEYIRVGAAVTFTRALESDLIPPIMKEAVSRIAAPAIRNAGTFGGNIGNGSDKADSVLAEFALDSRVRLISAKGERVIPVDQFCIRRRVTDLHDDELIAEILIPKDKCALPYYYKKVGGRNALAISRVVVGGVYKVSDGIVTDFSAAFIGGGDVCKRFREIEKTIIGRSVDEIRENIDEYVKAYSDNLTFTRGRVSAEYRRTVITNLLKDYIGSLS